jgi:hypothetical protein
MHDRTITEVEEMETARDCDRDRPQVGYWVELTGDELEAILKGLACYRHECLTSPEYVYRDRVGKIQRLSDRLEGEKP